jgi:hypothetical protein
MKEVFIPITTIPIKGTTYTISSDGIIRNDMFYPMTPIIRSTTKTFTCITITLSINGRKCTRMVHKIISDAFNPTPPDNYNVYRLYTIDGDLSNHSLSNLGWELAIKNKKYAFQPYIVNIDGKLFKTCGTCGKVKEIDMFYRLYGYESKKASYIRHECNKCTQIQHKILYMKRPGAQEATRKYFNQYRNNDRKNIGRIYLSQLLGISIYDISPQLLQIYQKKLLVIRKIRKLRQLKQINHG